MVSAADALLAEAADGGGAAKNGSQALTDGELKQLKSGAAKGGTGTHGAFYIIKPGKNEAKILSHAVLDGRCFATPSIYNGKVYVQTTKKLYCFGKPGNNRGLAKAPKAKAWPKAGKPTRLQIVPSEILLEPGESASFRARRLDANGFLVDEIADGMDLVVAVRVGHLRHALDLQPLAAPRHKARPVGALIDDEAGLDVGMREREVEHPHMARRARAAGRACGAAAASAQVRLRAAVRRQQQKGQDRANRPK